MSNNLTLLDAAHELRSLFDTQESLEPGSAELVTFENEMEPAFARALRKVESFNAYLVYLDTTAAACGSEIKRLQARKKTMEARAERLRDYAVRSMQEAGVTRLESPTAGLIVRKNPDAVDAPDVKRLPHNLVVVDVRLRESAWYAALQLAALYDASLFVALDVANDQATRTADKVAIKAELKLGEVPGAGWKHSYRLEVR